MSENPGKQTDQRYQLLSELAHKIFISESYHDSLRLVLEWIAGQIDPEFSECRSKPADDSSWNLTVSIPPQDQNYDPPENGFSSGASTDFFKPSLDVVDEVWVADLPSTDNTVLPNKLRNSNTFTALSLQLAFSNGRYDLFRFFYSGKNSSLNKHVSLLKKLLTDLKSLLKKKHEQHLLHSSFQMYRRLFDEDINPGFIADPDGKIVNCNQAFVDLFRFKSKKAALQSNFSDRFTNYMHQVFFWEALHRGEEINNHEMPASTVDGQNVYLMLKITCRYHEEDPNELKEVIGYIQDITSRKEVEDALRKSEERYRSLIETTNDWIWEIDENFCFTYTSLKIQTILGYDINSVLGESIFQLMPDSRRKNSESRFRALAREQNEFVREEHAFKDASGNLFIFETSGIPLFNNSGIFQGYRGIAKDITERKKTEKQIARLNDELENKVIERTKMLQIANKELEAFSYSVSHDLRAPLRSIDGFSQALIEDYGHSLDDTAKNYLTRVRSAAQRMSTLIDDMIKLAKVSRTTIEKKNINLSEIVESIGRGLHENEKERDAEFVIQPGIKAIGDKNLLQVALQNLMENAWKFTSKNEETRIEFGKTQREGETHYFIKDNGAGFDMNYAGKLFTPFQRLHKEREFPGTGIGLSTVQRIVHRHLGKIFAEGEPGSGAVFYFTLNLKPGPD
ncbi:PAS domain-containing sensor histidine kinase [Rhodohalobacter sp. SW132]|uniref:sensor histidine kinase n=1 Tax=Rhodohalobacter sp. SW132 TaxID=2293433 RepID=UPI000E23F990|nr:PAS domain-containing sensor histidine kinase [Rhodohalobacter sp. SW132]REL38711.1 PAS domain-containing sensor histidine kinase [Rhodohalobacter sp. SW132]